MVIAGRSDDVELYEVEVVDLLNPSSNCGFLAYYPVEISYHTATYIDGVVKSCGGRAQYNESLAYQYQHCYNYEPVTDEWTQSASLLKPRSSMASSVIGDTWLISGGRLIYGDCFDGTCWDDVNSNDTEAWTGGSFAQGSAFLPEVMEKHCQATINSTHIFFADSSSPRPAYILDYPANKWTQVDNIPGGDSTDKCGRIENSANGAEIVLAGDGYTYIFNLDTLEWKEGPHLFPQAYYYASAQLENTFVLAGGELDSDESDDSILIFDNENYEWILLEQTMKVTRQAFAMAAVPTGFVDC